MFLFLVMDFIENNIFLWKKCKEIEIHLYKNIQKIVAKENLRHRLLY